MKKDLVTEYDLEREDFEVIFARARELKQFLKEGRPHPVLAGKTLGMIFEKASTRTRLSFEVGMYQLGGLALFLNTSDTQLGRGETVADTAKIMSRYLDGIMIRTYAQKTVEDLAAHAEIPVINGLTDLLHPCQILSDLFTIMEKKGDYRGVKLAYIGDGNNVANSWINVAARLPVALSLACPEGYDPDGELLARARKEAPAGISIHRDPIAAVEGADIIYTDVWASMGQEGERELRARVFRSYQVNKNLLSRAKGDCIVMHCLPAHRGEEITSEVIDGPHSVVLDQAENRLHVQKAILEILMKKETR
ncbi:MAG TPA: ornithine carbamoyltransferase [Syntrophales bacterium]|jgi:ornithine carbamoyltransferase|nr:ornithine carbamoyltransferase [Syntrophales bacterium]HON23575.1 ornithine carbamoyltransferase [Syntrophales bacterium]HOU76617.1 ornithine carbamoyltransferase [Syntrophales bacterium]HPC31374.1 ornithine carbamoyltransferase [Syntrophales bacterium]HQG33280.1 ornithine carbamoyltransferase [Syntrophales bacterium]